MSFAEIADSFFKPAVQDLVPYEPGKPVEEVQRELGLERVVKLASNEGPFGPFPAALEAIEREAPRAEPLSGRRRVAAPHGARRAARRALRGGRARSRLRRDRRLPLAARARPGRRDRVRLAVFPELRDRRAQARRRARGGSAPRPPLRPRRDARGDRAEDEARLRLPPEQPDRDDEHEGRTGQVPGSGPWTCPDGPRPGVLRVHRRSGVRGRARVPEGRAQGSRAADVLEDLRARRAARGVRASGRRSS